MWPQIPTTEGQYLHPSEAGGARRQPAWGAALRNELPRRAACRNNHPHVRSAITGSTEFEDPPLEWSFLWLSCSQRHWAGPWVLPELLFFAASPQTLPGTRWGTTHSTALQEKPLQTEIRSSCTSAGALPHAPDMAGPWVWCLMRGGTWRRKGTSKARHFPSCCLTPRPFLHPSTSPERPFQGCFSRCSTASPHQLSRSQEMGIWGRCLRDIPRDTAGATQHCKPRSQQQQWVLTGSLPRAEGSLAKGVPLSQKFIFAVVIHLVLFQPARVVTRKTSALSLLGSRAGSV